MIFRQKILENPPIRFNVMGSVFRNRKQIEIDFLLASETENCIYAYEIKRGKFNKQKEVNKLITKVMQLEFKSIRLKNPIVVGKVLSLKDL